MSPELLFDEEYTFSADMFPFGLVLFEMMARKVVGKDDFCERSPRHNFTMDYDLVRNHLNLEELPVELIDMATLCTDYEPTDRPLARDATSWMEDIVNNMAEDEIEPPEAIALPDLDDAKLTNLIKEEEKEETAPSGPCLLTKEISERVIMEKAKSVRLNKLDLDTLAEEASNYNVDDNNNDAESMSSARQSFTNTVVAGPAKLKMGWLFKRNRHGFRNWKKRWFVLKSTGKESELSWYVVKPGEERSDEPFEYPVRATTRATSRFLCSVQNKLNLSENGAVRYYTLQGVKSTLW